VGHRPPRACLTWSLLLASAYTLLGMRCAHPAEFVPQWPSDNNSVNHARRNGHCGTNTSERFAAQTAGGI